MDTLQIDPSFKKTLKVGVIGCGRNSEHHLRVYAHTKGVELAAVCDIQEALAEKAAKSYGAKQFFTRADQLLKLDLDLVDIVTPTPTHAALTIQALESGHDVLVEKPMSLSSSDCLEMIAASRRSGRCLCVNHNKRFYNCVLETKNIIQQEGASVSRMRFSHFFIYNKIRPNWILTEETGGVLWEAMVHHVYMLEHFLGRIQTVYAVAKKTRSQVCDSISFLTRSEDEREGFAEYERFANAPVLELQILTDNGDRFDVDLFDDMIMRAPPARNRNLPFHLQRLSDDLSIPVARWRNRLWKRAWKSSYGTVTPYKRTFYVLITRLLSYLAGESTAPPVPAEEGLQSIRVLEAAKRSIESGEPLSVQESDVPVPARS